VRYASSRPGFAREDASDIRPIPCGEANERLRGAAAERDTPLPFPLFWDALAREKLRARQRVAWEILRARWIAYSAEEGEV
jgi:hypothetical protein